MKLYFAPLACSFVVRIVANETKTPLEYRQVEVWAKTLTEGGTYRDVSPIHLVPILELDDGERIGEVQAMGQLLADRAPGAGLLAPVGSVERYRILAWLSHGVAELHKRIVWPLANREVPKDSKRHALALAPAALDHLDRQLVGREWIAADRFTLADAHVGWVLSVMPRLGIDLGERPALGAYVKRFQARPSVREAFAAELPLLPAALERQASIVAPSV